ncbi:MAG: PBP1A family penicillin-binding protein [bacterium]|nr:PBP1A family penicillin-binding protein [bacterium]
MDTKDFYKKKTVEETSPEHESSEHEPPGLESPEYKTTVLATQTTESEFPVKQKIKNFFSRHMKVLLYTLGFLITILVGALVGIILVYQKGFPQIEALEDIQPKVMTVLHDDQGNLIKEYAIEKRTIVRRSDIPDVLIDALVASEDNQFYSHWGINFKGTFRAIIGVLTGKRKGGGSSITQQLALNLFLNRERTLSAKFNRKFKEILMAIQIEKRYSKDQILTFYCNKIYLGASVYGVEEAAQYYFGKSVRDINLAEAALIPTIMPSPNGKYDVFKQPENCITKRNYILKQMLELGYVTREQYEEAIKHPLPKKPFEAQEEEIGNYFVEEVRKSIESKFGDNRLYTGGLRVYTTLNREMQTWAEDSLKDGLRSLDKRIGWRTKPKLFNFKTNYMDLENDTIPSWKKYKIEKGNILEGVVLTVNNRIATVRIGDYRGVLTARNAKWTRRRLTRTLKVGDVALFGIESIPKDLQKYLDLSEEKRPENIDLKDKKYRLSLKLQQEPMVQGAMLVVDNQTGEIKAMVGGYSFDKSKWNNATQALRQTGSTIKPIVYTAALENGFTPSTLMEDEYFSYFDQWTAELWEPRNHGGSDDFLGPLTFRRAFEKSRNVVTARIAEYIKPQKIVEYAKKFGITAPLKPYMSISLGAFEVKLSEMVAAYTVFPNMGVRVKPFLIRKIVDHNDHVLEENYPDRKNVIDKETAFVMNYLMQGVVRYGTGYKARGLKAPIGGKTGTTNEFTNAWFIGFSPSVTVGVWVGYEDPKTLGDEETGSRTASPVFVSFMTKYLEKYPEPQHFRKPSGVIWVTVDKYTGKLSTPDCLYPFREAFLTGTEPLEYCNEEYHQEVTDYYGKEDDEEEGDGEEGIINY